MEIIVNELKCVGCGLCAAACPREALKTYGIVLIDHDKCRECFGGIGLIGSLTREDIKVFLKEENNWQKACIRNCPVEAITEINNEKKEI
ncbi:MAG: 4Fe-4S binding protein [Desulfobacterales bacterium]